MLKHLKDIKESYKKACRASQKIFGAKMWIMTFGKAGEEGTVNNRLA